MKVKNGQLQLKKVLMLTTLAAAIVGCDGASETDAKPDLDQVGPTAGSDLVVFKDATNPYWPMWDCCGGTTPTTETESNSYGLVSEFQIHAQASVLGFMRSKDQGPLDVSQIAAKGTLEFDLKMTASPGQTEWKVKLESNGGAQNGATGEEVELTLDAPVLNTWAHTKIKLADLENLGLDVASIDNILIYPAWGTGAGATYRVDNVEFVQDGNTDAPTPPASSQDIVLSLSAPVTDFGGAVTDQTAQNPTASVQAMSASSSVMKTTKSAEAEAWAGTSLGDIVVLPVTEQRSIITVSVYSPKVGAPVLLKLENALNDTQTVEVLTLTTKSNQWETLTFDFTKVKEGSQALNPAFTFDKKSIFFDFLVKETQDEVFYWDNVTFVEAQDSVDPVDPVDPGNGGTTTVVQGIDFENQTLTWEVFENADNPAMDFIDNPNVNGLNVSNTAAKIVARKAGQPWAGTVTRSVESFALNSSVSTVKMMVYKDKISPVVFKLATESQWGAEISVTNTKIGEWEELTFDFSQHPEFSYVPGPISEVVVFPDFDASATRTEDSVMLFDSITFGPSN